MASFVSANLLQPIQAPAISGNLLEPAPPNPFSLILLDSLIFQFGLWEAA
ncbi:MAG TPA: hypothetical protein V6C65_15035 [Allocoleopsis sp.]